MKIQLTLEELYYVSEADYNFKEFFKESLEKSRKSNDYVMLLQEGVPENEMTVELKRVYINTVDNLYFEVVTPVDHWPS